MTTSIIQRNSDYCFTSRSIQSSQCTCNRTWSWSHWSSVKCWFWRCYIYSYCNCLTWLNLSCPWKIRTCNLWLRQGYLNMERLFSWSCCTCSFSYSTSINPFISCSFWQVFWISYLDYCIFRLFVRQTCSLINRNLGRIRHYIENFVDKSILMF